MVIDVFLTVLGACLLLTGLAGCVLPVIPGPPLCYLALLCADGTSWAHYSWHFLLITAALATVITVIDYMLPVWGVKRLGGSKAGTTGATIGLIVGLFFGPVGILIGPFAGALIAELLAGKDSGTAIRSGLGSFVGFIVGTGLKIALCVVFAYYFVAELI